MDDDPAHTMDEVTTQRSAEDWKRMHDRVYQLSQNLEAEIQRLTKEVERLKIRLEYAIKSKP